VGLGLDLLGSTEKDMSRIYNLSNPPIINSIN